MAGTPKRNLKEVEQVRAKFFELDTILRESIPKHLAKDSLLLPQNPPGVSDCLQSASLNTEIGIRWRVCLGYVISLETELEGLIESVAQKAGNPNYFNISVDPDAPASASADDPSPTEEDGGGGAEEQAPTEEPVEADDKEPAASV